MDERLKSVLDDSYNVVFFGGAGVSTESNIPDFRSESGLYKAQQEYGYAPEEMLSRHFFDRHTKLFFDYYKKNLIHREAKPNKAHYALAKLEEMGKLRAIATQNIDGLHQMAGSKNVYELHGSVLRNFCMKCHEAYDLDYIMDESHCKDGVPKCPVCGGTIKPDVVLYEEPLDDRVMEGAITMIQNCDTLIIGGTSLAVYPAAGLVRYFRGDNLVLINKQPTPYDDYATLVINDSIGKVMDMEK